VAPTEGRPPTEEVVGHIPFTPRAKKCLQQSLKEATELHSGYLGVEHLASRCSPRVQRGGAHPVGARRVRAGAARRDLDRYRQAS